MKFDKSFAAVAFGEILGTSIMMFVGCTSYHLGWFRYALETCFAFGMAVMAAIQSADCYSGANLNPNVTVAAIILKIVEWDLGLFYILFQFIGSILGYGCFLLVQVDHPQTIATCLTERGAKTSVVQAIFVEFMLTMVYVLMYCAIWDKRNDNKMDSIPIRVGLMVTSCMIAGRLTTGGSMNWWRSLTPALFELYFKGIWIYFVGQIPAAILTPLFWKFVMQASDGGGGGGGSNDLE